MIDRIKIAFQGHNEKLPIDKNKFSLLVKSCHGTIYGVWMKSKILKWVMLSLGGFFILSSLVITIVEAQRFNNQPVVFPPESRVAGLPVGGLSEGEAVDRIVAFYELPLVLKIEGSTIHAAPQDLGFGFDAEALVSTSLGELNPGNFWDSLWGPLKPQPVVVPLTATVDDDAILDFLTQEIAPRYTQPGLPVTPIPNTTNFAVSTSGESLDLSSGLTDIRNALLSPETNIVELQTLAGPGQAANKQMLQAFLQHNIHWIDFDGLVEVYLEPLPSGETLHFATNAGNAIEPDVAFTAASTIKIPIMISVLHRTDDPTPQAVITLLEQMIAFSENPPADTLMATYLDEVRGPLIVSEDLAALGMENTFLAGYFYLGAPVLQLFETPANIREDVFLDPDIYNQTVPSEAGELLAAIYRCAKDESGLLTETFPGEISQAECQLMIDILSGNQIGLLIEAGLPPEATAAHKHGWVQELDGVLRSMSDVAIVFTTERDYALTIFLHDPQRLDFDQGNRLITRLSQTVYNFFNLENQTHWWFD
jgi:beta-lactamase class A